MRAHLALVVVTAISETVACADPVREKEIAALGPETPGIPEGPLHRAGQPCATCHSDYGPGAPEFSLAGTIYQTEDTKVPLVDGLVKFIDSRGRVYQTATNCAGNFFVLPTDYSPHFPVWVKVSYGTFPNPVPGQPPVPFEVEMGSPIYREASCSKCHGATPGPKSAGHVFLAPPGVPFPPPRCAP